MRREADGYRTDNCGCPREERANPAISTPPLIILSATPNLI